ncbi:hypothetical protein niasHS_002454 [Heterodera schachtii]|uniref:dTDP-D-glucose 4,6-dehydratase n=1 Tax=Heterodera schachtii TaxID=97005 RepID=A0ABD2KKH0_HETSC
MPGKPELLLLEGRGPSTVVVHPRPSPATTPFPNDDFVDKSSSAEQRHKNLRVASSTFTCHPIKTRLKPCRGLSSPSVFKATAAPSPSSQLFCFRVGQPMSDETILNATDSDWPFSKSENRNSTVAVLPQKVLVTGGCGFIGSNFINYIFEKWPKASFVNLDKLAFGASPDHIIDDIRFSPRYVFVHGSLLDENLVKTVLNEHRIDTVIHFAAITHVDESYTDRIGTIQENVIATTTLLEAINFYGRVRRLVHISTDEVYGDSMDDTTPKCEDSPLNPTNPYAASKAACEVIVRSYHHSYKLPYVMVRMNNVYGPRQAYSKLIPKFTRLALEGKPYPLMGDGMHSRSWMYVDDCAEAIRRITERGRIGQTYNIGTEFEKCNLHLTEMLHEKVQKLMDRDPSQISFEPIADRPYHDRRYYINFTKIREELGWECTVPFAQGLADTLDYYVKEYRKTHNAMLTAQRPHG